MMILSAGKNGSLYTVTPINDEDFEYLRAVVYRETGIRLSDMKRSLLQSRLIRRLRAIGLGSYSEYIRYLKDNYDAELLEFINSVTTNKTEFFRENQHFIFMREVALPEFEKKQRKRIRIWSAGCSTGEEAYSIAMTVREYYGDDFPDVKILATDIDTQVLEKAVKGIYSEQQVSEIDPLLRRKYFEPVQPGQDFCTTSDLKSMIVFKRLNLLDDTYPMKGKFDIIFCRNVVIYFDKPTQKRLFQKFSSYLSDDGYLCVGHSENLSGISDSLQHLGKTVYRKVSHGA